MSRNTPLRTNCQFPKFSAIPIRPVGGASEAATSMPTAAPDKEFIAEEDEFGPDFDDDFDVDDYDDLSFDENWN